MKISGGNWRVVVTGLGVVSPNGLGRVEFWEATRKGISGIAALPSSMPRSFRVVWLAR